MQRDLGVLVDEQLNASQQRAAAARKANGMLACISTAITSRDTPLCPALARPHLEYCIHQKRCGQAGEGPEKGHKDDQTTGKPVT